MTRYKQAEFVDEDSSSIGTIQLNESSHSPAGLQIRYHTARGTSLWRSRTKLEQCLLITTILLTFVVFVMIIVVSSSSSSPSSSSSNNNNNSNSGGDGDGGKSTKNLHAVHNNNNDDDDDDDAKPCMLEPCIHAASQILKSIDKTIAPCDDFYGFACNQWIENNPIPDGKSIWGTFGKLEQQNQLVIKNVLEKPDSYFQSEAEKKAKYYYQSCLDENEIMEKLGGKPLIKFIKTVGGWNITKSDFNLTNWNLEDKLKILQNKYNMGGLFSWAIGEDDKNSSRHIIQIDQGGLTLPTRDNYLNKTAHEKVLNAYLEYMTKVAVLLDANETDARAQMKEIIEFETKIAEITVPAEDRRNEEALYHPITLADLQIKANFIDWTSHFDDALSLVNRTVKSDEIVVVYALEFLEKLTKIIATYQRTTEGKIILNNYLVWQAVRTLTEYLSKSFRDSYKGVRKALIGSDGGEEPWRYCVADTNTVIGFAIGAMFVREKFDGTSKPEAEKMINQVRNAFKQNLKQLKWMDRKTIQLAEEKANGITDMIGFPNYIKNSTQLDAKYEELIITATEYFNNNLRINMFNLKKNLEKLNEYVNKSRWGMTPSTVNAYYTPTKNQIVFPAGILQLPFYNINNPKCLNFGGMGVVMGHELTHAFDDQGREYDKYGNLNRWWENQSIDEFNNKTQCFIQQYDNYKVNGQNVNGRQTLGENIADNGGLKAAYHAYISSTKNSNSNGYPLPGINMTQRQLFFISFAQVWCSSVTDEASTLQIEKDPHSPPKFRVIGPLSNLQEFADEFHCPPDTKMNPTNKCIVW